MGAKWDRLNESRGGGNQAIGGQSRVGVQYRNRNHEHDRTECKWGWGINGLHYVLLRLGFSSSTANSLLAAAVHFWCVVLLGCQCMAPASAAAWQHRGWRACVQPCVSPAGTWLPVFVLGSARVSFWQLLPYCVVCTAWCAAQGRAGLTPGALVRRAPALEPDEGRRSAPHSFCAEGVGSALGGGCVREHGRLGQPWPAGSRSRGASRL